MTNTTQEARQSELDRLKPCPFCGCKATFIKHSAGVPGTQGFDKWDAVACKHCRATIGASDRRFRSRDDAADAWNSRIKHPQHEADKKDAARYQWLRSRDLLTVQSGGVFAGKTPDNVVLNGVDLDEEIDSLIASTGEQS